MWSFIARRLIILIPVVIGVSFLVFAAMYVLPGDAVDSMLAERGASAEDLARLRAQLGLDDPFFVQYGRFIARLAQGDLGSSITTGRPVYDQISSQIGATIELTLAALFIAIAFGVPLGVIAAIRRGTWVDSSLMVVALLGV